MVRELSVTPDVLATTVARAVAGDVDALARIVAAHHDDMARLAFVITGDTDLAQDAVQAAWPVALAKLGSLRDPASLRPWLMSVAANQARSAVRSRRRHHVVELEIADVDAGTGDPAVHVAHADLATALGRLSAEDRALIALRHVAGFDATEIGRATGMSPSGVRSRLARAIARLRMELGDD